MKSKLNGLGAVSDKMKVSTSDLRKAVELIFRNLDETGNADIEINEDFYWSIPEEIRYDPYHEPTEHTLGQLSDDINELKRLVAEERQAIGRDLTWMSSILAAIAKNALPYRRS